MVLNAHRRTGYRYVRFLNDYCRAARVRRETVRVNTGSGMTTATYLRPRHCRAGVVLVCHSLGADRHYPFTELFIDLLQVGLAVFSIDLDGHGAGNAHCFSYPQVLSTLPRAMDCLQQRYGADRSEIVLFGHSLGGSICLHAAASEECQGVIAVSSPWRIERRARGLAELFSVLAPSVWRQLRYYSPSELAPALYSFKRKEFPCRTVGGSESYLDDVRDVLEQMALRSAVRRARAPLLQIHGKWDQLVSFRQAVAINRSYGGPKELVVLPRDTHFTSLFSGTCRRRIRSWLLRRRFSHGLSADGRASPASPELGPDG